MGKFILLQRFILPIILVICLSGLDSSAKRYRHRSSKPLHEYEVSEKEKLDKGDGELWYDAVEIDQNHENDEDIPNTVEGWIAAIRDLFRRWGYALNDVPKPFGNSVSNKPIKIKQNGFQAVLEAMAMSGMSKSVEDDLRRILVQGIKNHGNENEDGSTSDKKTNEGRLICEENGMTSTKRIMQKMELIINNLMDEKSKKDMENPSTHPQPNSNDLNGMEKIDDILKELSEAKKHERQLVEKLKGMNSNEIGQDSGSDSSASAEDISQAILHGQGISDKQSNADLQPLNVLLEEIKLMDTQMKEAKENEADFGPTFQKINVDLADLAQLGNQIRQIGSDNMENSQMALNENPIDDEFQSAKFHKSSNEAKSSMEEEGIRKVEAQHKSIYDLKSNGQNMHNKNDEHESKLSSIDKHMGDIASMKQKFTQEKDVNSNYEHQRTHDNYAKIDDQMNDMKHTNDISRLDKFMNNGGAEHQEYPTYYPRAPSNPQHYNQNQLKEMRNEAKKKMIISALKGTPEIPPSHHSSKSSYKPDKESKKYFGRLRDKVTKKNKRMKN